MALLHGRGVAGSITLSRTARARRRISRGTCTTPASQPALGEKSFGKDTHVSESHGVRLAKIEQPVLRWLVEIDASAVATAARAEGVSEREQASQEIRRVLADCVNRIQAGSKESYDELRKTPLDEAVPVVRQGWNQADGMVRQYAAMTWGNMESSPQLLTASPGRVLYIFDQYVQTLRVARRRLADAWGPLPNNPEFFFVQCCQKLFDEAREVFRSMPPEGERADGYLRQLESDFDRRKSGDLSLDVALTAVPEGAARGMEGKITVGRQGDLPSGTAALFCERNGLPTPAFVPAEFNDVKKQRDAIDLDDKALADGVRLRLEDSSPDREVVSALFFRGRYKTQSLVAPSEGAADVVAVRFARREPAKVRVVGQGAETSYIMFVLDCSGSMQFPGAPAENGTKRTRLEQAKDELPRVVESICSSYPNVNVGLILFGHREDELTSTRQVNERAATDVETVIRFQDHARRPGDARDMRDQFANRIRNLQPRGVTPLYRSIILAMKEFPRDSSPAQRHVIVLSDGADLTKFDYLEVLKVLRARVDVFEYKISREEQEKYGDEITVVRGHLRKICTDPKSGGDYYSNLTSWLDAIRNLQQPSKEFWVTSLADASWKASAKLDGTVEVGAEQLGGEFSIAVDGPDKVLVKLEGGERLELQYEAGQLRFARWPDVDDKDPLMLGGRQFRFAALAPEPYGSGRVFRAALREYEPTGVRRPSFTSRPTGIWAEVTADRGTGEAASRVPGYGPRVRAQSSGTSDATVRSDLEGGPCVHPTMARVRWEVAALCA